mgnify:CR=1 FL=1
MHLMKYLKKAQAFFMDFAIALVLFIFTLLIYFSYTANFQKQESGNMDAMLSDAKAISSSLVLSGYPAGWDNKTVVRIGIADGQKINLTKLKSFKKMDYSATKKKFGTIYDYFAFFTDGQGNLLSLNGVCGLGYPLENISYNIKSAYYYQDTSDSFLKKFMNQSFNADIYFGDDPGNSNDIAGLMSNISAYSFIVFEHPLLTVSNYNSVKPKIENSTSNGGIFMISGELVTAQGKNILGADFYKKSGQSASDRNSTINNTDDYLSFVPGESIVFKQAYYVQNTSGSDSFNQIATFNEDGSNAVSGWSFGNGSVYFFSDFDVSYFNGNFVSLVEDAAQGIAGGTCTPISLAGISPKRLVKTERYLNYDSKVVRMDVYVWQ